MWRKSDTRLNYKDSALRLLFKFERPTKDDVYHYLCRQDHCPNPDGKCNFLLGSGGGQECQHVITVKAIVDNLNAILDDTFEF
jgi:hypothetical protein